MREIRALRSSIILWNEPIAAGLSLYRLVFVSSIQPVGVYCTSLTLMCDDRLLISSRQKERKSMNMCARVCDDIGCRSSPH